MRAAKISRKLSETSNSMSSQSSYKDSRVVLVDVQNVSIEAPEAAVKHFDLSKKATVIECDILIVGGGLGGVAAAYEASRQVAKYAEETGLKVCLVEETDWLGGQITSQGVSAFDENKYVETSGACGAYLELRTRIRDFYREHRTLKPEHRDDPRLDPGSCWVSRLAFEPKVALPIIDEMLSSAVKSQRLQIFMRYKTAGVAVASAEGDSRKKRIASVRCVNLDSGEVCEFRSSYVIDATELGDVLSMAGGPYRSGSDPQSLANEAHAPEMGDPENVQDFTYPFVVEFCPGENHTIEKPPYYDEFNQAGKFSFQGYKMFEEAKRKEGGGDGRVVTLLPFWSYRRLIDKNKFDDAHYKFDISMINWDSNDLRGHNIIDAEPATMAQRLALGKCVSLGFLYWLQTEAPRDDGGSGYPELRLSIEVLGTKDGLSKYPYIRESRRIVAHVLVAEQDIVAATNPGARARLFDDSVGIGLYPVDIHGHQEVPGAAQETKPFQVPLGALLPVDYTNLVAGCKNVGVTHITNGAYRLHPIEWAIGTAAGTLLVECLHQKRLPLNYLQNKAYLREIQTELIERRSPVFWFEDVDVRSERFVACQSLAISESFSVKASETNSEFGKIISGSLKFPTNETA